MDMRYFNEKAECMPREELEKLQGARLVETVKRVYASVPSYRKKMDEAGITPEDIRGREDLKKLPFTVKQDLRDNYPFGLLAVPMKDIARVHASSGTTGKLTVVGYTKHDLDVWEEIVARCLAMAGGTEEDIINVCYGYGLFTGGLGVHGGAQKLGATVVPMSTGNTARQVMLLKDFQSTGLCCTPSYALYIGEELKKEGYSAKDLNLKFGCFGAEPWSDEIRKRIEDALGLEAFDIYGLSEIMGPGVAMDCKAHNGKHIWEDHFIAEVIDPVTLEPLPYGSQGELVISTITKEGLPILRYRTKDLCTLYNEPCACGRTHVRIGRIVGRSDDMLIVRGVNVFPSQIETVLLKLTDQILPYYQIVVDRVRDQDTLEVQVEMSEHLFSDEIKQIELLKNRLEKDLLSMLGISAKVKIVEPYTLPRTEGKAKRVVDKRVI